MKRKKLLGVMLCISLCFTLSGCKVDNSTENSKSEVQQEEKIEDKTEEDKKTKDDKIEEVISLSDKKKKILENLFNQYVNYKDTDITSFVSWVVNNDEVLNFNKTEKATEYYRYAIKPDLGIKIMKDALGVTVSKGNFKLNEYGNIDIIEAAGESPRIFINKAVKISEDEYKVYASRVIYNACGIDYSGSYVFRIKENSESMFGYTIKSSEECDKQDWIPENITASSSLESSTSGTYDVSNLMDKNLATAWAEGAEGLGIGEYVLFESSNSQKVSGAFIHNGYLKSDDILNKNGSISKVKFEFSDGTIIESDLYTMSSISFYDSSTDTYGNYVNFGKEIDTKFIKMIILGVSEGTSYEDTCVSEIRFIK